MIGYESCKYANISVFFRVPTVLKAPEGLQGLTVATESVELPARKENPVEMVMPVRREVREGRATAETRASTDFP